MKLGTAIAEILKREGIEILCGYPVNHLIEHAANADIRPMQSAPVAEDVGHLLRRERIILFHQLLQAGIAIYGSALGLLLFV